jgi:F0F1-type ATP synthase assembly protein I
VNSSSSQRPPGRRPAAGSESAGWAIFSYLIGGMAVYGGAGWLIGRWAGHTSAFLAGGMIVGLALALVMVIFRYGRA